ncbi:nucleotidyltransferase family protein [Marivirga sp. S37H4]|uniref:Nucleotidyltransferase family protein n=1 Tax=Marivirga aurantiaca TaxID=2802615 RepID=A0A934WX47_9BACT|nr:nucleotidyltransferase family protein [Marivirga aurantiaca]MBK6264517.1 nucleotidyltransferase family protein [Marivirga aurantiaca]
MNYKKHLVNKNSTVKEALAKLNQLAADAILFVVDEQNKLMGSMTDGDVRRGLLRDFSINDKVTRFIQPNPKFIRKGVYDLQKIISLREKNFKIIPVLDEHDRVINVVNFRFLKSYLPIDAIIMAGGRGQRLKPFTDNCPKPLLKVGDKPIMEHNMNRLISYGIDDFWISVRYLGEQIEAYFGDGTNKNVTIDYVHEQHPLGTIGAIGQIKNLKHNSILVTNSDLLTNLDYEDFYLNFIESKADLAVVTIPYEVNIPYAVLETSNGHVVSFKEKPTYTYFSNGGVYLMKKEVIELIPKDKFYDATDLMEDLIKAGKKVFSYPLRGYWLDIGKPEDFEKAKKDIKLIKF